MTQVVVNIPMVSSTIFRNRLLYVLDFIKNHPCAPKNVTWTLDSKEGDINISYGIDGRHLNMPNACLCFENLPRNNDKEHICLQYNGMTLYGFKGKDEWKCHFFADIFQTIFFHISRLEEWNAHPNDLDPHGMLSSKNHFFVRHNIHEIPIVDHLVYYLYQELGLMPTLLVTKYNVSHDLDAIQKFPSFYKFLRAIANVVLVQDNKISSLFRLIITWYQYKIQKINDPYDTFEWLFETNSSKINSKYLYVLSGGKTRYENFFDINDPKIKSLVQNAVEQGYVIGIHPSYMAGENKQMTETELKSLEKISNLKIEDSRQHFLRYFIPKTGEILEQLNLKTDSSFGYRNLIGFRCGTGFPYKMYNFNQEKPYNFVEIPMVVMDMALIHCFGRDTKVICRHLDSFISRNKNFTLITFNFHNSTFDPTLMDASEFRKYYISLFSS